MLTGGESAVLPMVLQCLSFRGVASHVCHDWRKALGPGSPAYQWYCQQLLVDRWPWAAVPQGTSASRIEQIYKTRHTTATQQLPALFGDTEFLEECKMGKYSQWVLTKECQDGSFLIDLAWAVRILYCTAPPAYLTMDGADESPYNPGHSNRAGSSPGWNIAHQDTAQLLLDESGYFGLRLLRSLSTRHMPSLSTMQEICDNHIPQRIRDTTKWAKALDVVEHTKLLLFLLQEKRRCLALFWDVDSIVCRRIDCLVAVGVNGGTGRPQSRQVPPMFNIIKLGQHAESFTWGECCSPKSAAAP